MIKFTPIEIMTLGFVTLFFPKRSFVLKKTLVFLLVVLSCFSFSQNSGSIDDVKKQADKLFKEDQFTEAYKFYSQLVANYPKDPEYNYRLGVCMIYAEPDKKKCLPYLKLAAVNPVDAPKEVFFYLGKAYHINYRFDDAIKNYNEFKKTASASLQKKLGVDREIKACAYGKYLMSNLTDLIVLNKKELAEADYFRSYNLEEMGGKLIVKPEEFKTKIDKKKKENSVIFLATGSDVVYFSSYGDNTETGRDIYTAVKQIDGTYGKPAKVAGINTEFDEDFPFLHPNGKILYFASKGHNGMGGYDIFKSQFNENSASWGPPENLEFPVNSPDDDFLFVTDSAGTLAYFSTGRQSPPGMIDVLKVKTERRPIDIVGVKGTVEKGQVDHSLASTILVKDLFTGTEINTYYADEEGNYALELPNGGKLVFTVETPGMETQSAQVTLPASDQIRPYRQSITYDNGKLKILNYFDDVVNETSYMNYLNVIEKKAKLEVTEEAVKAGEEAPKVVPVEPLAIGTTKPQVISLENNGAGPATTGPKNGLTNKQLSVMAKEDATESRAEAAQLQKDSKDAKELGEQQKAKANADLAKAEAALTAAQEMNDETEKKRALNEATALKSSAESDQVVAEKIIAFSETLSQDAKTKEKEALLNEQYAAELEKAVASKDNKASLAKLEELQKEIEGVSKKEKESDNHIAELKVSIDEKEKLLSATEETNAGIKVNLEEVKAVIGQKETELLTTKGKKDKKELNTEITALKTEQADKESQITSKNDEITALALELTGLKNELDVANKIKAENLAASAERAEALSPHKYTEVELKAKYKGKTEVADPTSRASVEESINQLNKYNKDIESSITKYKADLTASKKKEEKQKITNEISALQAAKKQNLAQISSNFNRVTALKKLETQDNVVAENNSTYLPIATQNPKEAIVLLNELSADLAQNEKVNFEAIPFTNPEAQSKKEEAVQKLNEAIEQQNKLAENIATSKAVIGTIDTLPKKPVVTTQKIYKEVEVLETQSRDLRKKATSANGAEKEKLLAQAKSIEEEIQDKNIEAAEITKNDNTMIIATNKENIQNLLKLDKLSDTEKESAKKLSDEAVTAFRSAVDIRAEGNSLTNKGAKLGSFSNAEEQEAEAILKQQQAIEILMRGNPDYVLKPIITSTTALSEEKKGPDLDSNLIAVNSGIAEIAAIKVQSYRKLYEANDLEISDVNSKVKKNESLTEKNPALKTELISGNKKTENARKFYQDAEKSIKVNDQLNYLISAVKQQNLALQQLNTLNTSLEDLALHPPSTASESKTTGVKEKENITPTEVVSVTEVTASKQTKPEVGVSASAKIISILDLAIKDTTTDDLIHYYDSYEPQLSNPEANASAQSSLSKLKDMEAQNRDLKEALATATDDGESGDGLPVDPALFRKQADSLLAESEDIMEDAEDAKKEAAGKKGENKQKLLNESKELQNLSEEKMFESSAFIQRANEADYKSNSIALTELLDKLNAEDPALANELSDRRASYEPLKSQIKNLRIDANTLQNKSARLGAIGNAEEKESELIQKQNELLTILKKRYPDYEVKPYVAEKTTSRSDLLKKRTELRNSQYEELTNLINAFSLEFEALKTQVPATISTEQEAVKKNAEELNAESKMLLIKSVSVTEEHEKIKMLTLSSKYGGTAVDQLSSLISGKTPASVAANDTKALEEIGKSINASGSKKNPVAVTKTKVKSSTVKSQSKVDGLEIVEGNAYSNAKPIPVDAPIESGLVFRVQIGAFRTQIPNNAFKGLSPLNGETTPSGYIRYTAGNFNKVENANAVKNDLRGLGYRDAFVVAYLNGKRITLGEAMVQLGEQGITVDPNAPQTAGITSNLNIPKAATNAELQEAVAVTKELEKINGLLYTIQLGVFTKQVTSTQLLNLKPIFSEQLTNGLYRYTAGIYNSSERLFADKSKVVDRGLRDAFVSAYLNGKRIPYNEAKAQQENDATVTMEPENPIVFPASQGPEVPASGTPVMLDPAVKPFTNNVTTYPEATAENGIKNGEEGVSYKVQIGAYSKQVPEDIAAKFLSIKTWPVENKQINALYIYNVGNFSEVKFARNLRDELKTLGMTDAYITVYRDGRKIYGVEAENLLR
ncbi:MAG: hypothetical protein PSX36_07355 [bacterium]|nr:hypothetical protein [bacterium]